MSVFHQGWYLLYTRPRHEKKVSQGLSKNEFEHFLPTRKVLRTLHDRKKYLEEPLFPSYVFIYLKDMQTYYGGLDTEGVLYYVKTAQKIARVEDAVVKDIKLLISQAKDLEASTIRFQPGKKLVISKGPLTGLTCEVVKIDCKQKLLVRVDLLQRHLIMSLPDEYLLDINFPQPSSHV